ncbi:protein D1-like [Ornithodoros turicata]|uniref:protein D1-like n=1 Tax=Ornithodoros turicata TaxID=34597 RepID=UPI00313A3DB8
MGGDALFLCVAIAAAVACVQADNRDDLRRAHVIPDVVDEAPGRTLVVKYDDTEVLIGRRLDLKTTANAPGIELEPDKALYTLVMVDPDAPSRKNPTRKHWLHWLVVNIPAKGGVSAGDTITPYNGPSPPSGTGLHRYVFLLYAQTSPVERENLKIPSGRGNFKLATVKSTPGVSHLTATNFFTAANAAVSPFGFNITLTVFLVTLTLMLILA